LAGCQGVDADALTIATAWTTAQRVDLEKAILAALPGGVRIHWILLAPGDDLRRVVRRRVPPDLILGGPISVYEALAPGGAFQADERGGPGWRVAPSRRYARPAPWSGPVRALQQQPPLHDPRRDPWTLAWGEAEFHCHPWAAVYASLVLHDLPRVLIGLECAQGVGAEGVAVVRGAPHAAAGRTVLTELARLGRVTPPPKPALSPEARSLLADLLGATLVDARVELSAARRALIDAGQPERPRQWMTQAPPWPPASVAKILERESNAMPLLETLAAQIAPEADVRAWLLRSWLSPSRRIDGATLDELAGAVHGRLAREPRFRSWLRGEWTAWARQRYRRVARQAASPEFAGAKS